MPRPLIPERKERILAAAETLVVERGFDAMSVQAIAERAGIAKGAVYREFSGKAELLEAVLSTVSARMQDEVAARLTDDPLPSLSVAYRVGLDVLRNEPLMIAAFLDDQRVLGSQVAAVHDGRYRRRMLAIADWIVQLQQAGRLQADIDPDGLALALSSLTLGLLSAAADLGPLTAEQLSGAITAVEAMVAGLER